MSNWMKAGQVIGIVGEGVEAFYLTQTALRMGYQVLIYNDDEFNMAGSIADEHWIGSINNREELLKFADQCDVLIYTTRNISTSIIQAMMERTHLPQGTDILSMTQDRILQKVQLDAMYVNVAPYTTALNKDDLQKGIQSIGYPAKVSPNHSRDYQSDHVILQNQADLDQLDADLLAGTGLMESYSPDARHFSIIVGVNAGGELAPISLSELDYQGHRLKAAFNPPQVEDEIAVEMFRIAMKISTAYDFSGVLTIDFAVTPQYSIYVTDLVPFTTQAGVYTLSSQHISQYEMFIRIVTHRPLSDVHHFTPSIAFPFYQGQESAVEALLSQRPGAQVFYYNETHPQAAKGHVNLITEEVEDLDRLRQQVNFFN